MAAENKLLNILKSFQGKSFQASESAAGRHLEYKIKQVESGHIILNFTVLKQFTNPIGTLHGGMMSCLIDECCGLAFLSSGNKYFYTTVDLQVNFLEPAFEGAELRAEAKVEREGRRLAHISCSVFNDQNVLLATASSNLIKTDQLVEQFLSRQVS